MYRHHACYIQLHDKSTRKKGEEMETKILLFNAVQRKYGLTQRQMYHIREKIKKYHKNDNWLIKKTNSMGETEIWIYMEAVEWIKDVYLNFDESYIHAEILFAKKQIQRLEHELNFHADPIVCVDMDVSMLATYFNLKTNTIYKKIKEVLLEEHPYFILKKNPIVVSEEGVRWLEINVFEIKYLTDLLSYKRRLQKRKRELSL